MHPDELSFTSGLDASGNMSSRQLYQVCVAQDELVDEVRSLDFFTQTLVDACFAERTDKFAVGEKIAGKRITAQLLFPRKDFSKNPARRPEQNMLTVPVTFLRSKKDNALM